MNQPAKQHESIDRRVLENRPLHDGADVRKLSRFSDDAWDLRPAFFAKHVERVTFHFSHFPASWRPPIKEYIWHLINADETPSVTAAKPQKRLSIRTIAHLRPRLAMFIRWVDEAGYVRLADLTHTHLDEYIAQKAEQVGAAEAARHIVEIRRLWLIGSLADPLLKFTIGYPWAGSSPEDVAGVRPQRGENRTPRIDDGTLAALIVWSFRFITEFSPDIIRSYKAYRRVVTGSATFRRRRGIGVGDGTPEERFWRAVNRRQEAGVGLPGHTGAERINWYVLGAETRVSASAHTKLERLARTKGLQIDSYDSLPVRATGLLDGGVWLEGAMRYKDAVPLANHLQTACLIVIAYLSGMRAGELLNLERGCVTTLSGGRVAIAGRQWKGVTDSTDSHDPRGHLRTNPWIVHPTVADAVNVLEQLHDRGILFPHTLMINHLRYHDGEHQLERTMPSTYVAVRVAAFAEWVNEYCAAGGRTDGVPADPAGGISLSRFRRTLAWHIVRRPHGLVAAAIQYGHVAPYVTQGYAGNYQTGFSDEIAMEAVLEKIEESSRLASYLSENGRLSGPASDELKRRVAESRRRFEGRVIPTARQAKALLLDPELQIHQGKGMHCVFNAERALCVKQGAAEPLMSRCQPTCANIVRTDDDIRELERILGRLASLMESDTLAPPIRYARSQEKLEQLAQIAAEHRR